MAPNNNQCLNCTQQLQGNFCHLCGQENIDINVSFTELIRDFFGDMFTYDSRFYRTIVPLLIKPGWLTVEFYKGRRIPYVPPLRLYLFISFILFLWLALVDTGYVNMGDPSLNVNELNSEIVGVPGNPDSPEWVLKLAERFSTNITLVAQNEDMFINVLSSRLPYLMFLLLPIFALILWLHFARSNFSYLQHFVFTLHFHAFAYLVNLIFSIVDQIRSWEFFWYVVLLFNIYLILALRRVYLSGWQGAILKTISILFLYVTILIICIGLFFFVNVINFS